MPDHPPRMAEPPIPPALSPEEWRDGYDSRDLELRRKTPGLDGSPRLHVSVRGWPLGGSMGDNRDFHALAALSLYGQPFGFSHEDVALVRAMAEAERRHRTNWLEVGEADLATTGLQRVRIAESLRISAERLDSLASRLAALLPPTADDGTTP